MNRFFLSALSLILTLFFVSTPVHSLSYHIGKDEEGYYIQTEMDGRWAIAPEDVTDAIRVGDGGSYRVLTDGEFLYLETENHGEFMIDKEAYDQSQQDRVKSWEGAGESETKVIINGNQVLVPVTFSYNGNTIESLLLLDTGASITVVNRDLAEQLNIENAFKTEVMVVGGNKIETDLIQVDYIEAGPVRVENLTVGIIDHQGEPVQWEGLLGMNFLRKTDYQIDFENKVIHWNR